MKRLSFRFCRRALLILAILFPIVYLCGGLFFGLAGAHGEQMFAEPIYEEQYIEVEESNNASRIVFNENCSQQIINSLQIKDGINSLIISTDNYILNGIERVPNTQFGSFYIEKNSSSNTHYSVYTYPNRDLPFPIFYAGNLSFQLALPWTFEGESSLINSLYSLFNCGIMYSKVNVPIAFVPENNSAYTDFIFSQPFANDNFISQLGRGVLNDTAFGFPPFKDMFNWFNDSVMHIEPDDALGVFGFGYAYYAMNVVAVYELVVLVLMVFTLPLKITDRFMGDKL